MEVERLRSILCSNVLSLWSQKIGETFFTILLFYVLRFTFCLYFVGQEYCSVECTE